MLKEICITPEVFDEEHLDNSNWKDVKNLLENIENSGYIIGLNNNDWKKEVRHNINKFDLKIKDRLNSILDVLNNRNRIVGHPKGNIKPLCDEEWKQIAEGLNNIRDFYSIITTLPFSNNCISLEQLEDININETFGITGSKHYIKTVEELERIFIPLLSYARKVTIIDPYFDLNTKRYKETLEYISKAFKNKRGIKEKGTITINCSDKIFTENIIKNWQSFIKFIYSEFGHLVTINVWGQKYDSLKMHDRYIITDQSGISSAAGTDKDDRQQSEWSIKDYCSLNGILEQYTENYPDAFELRCIVTASCYEKKR